MILALVLLMPSASIALGGLYSGKYFLEDLYITVKTTNDIVLGSAKVYLFIMTDSGWKLLSTTYTNSIGVAVFKPMLPLIHANTLEVNGRKLEIYKSINLMVIVVKRPYIGLYIFAVDPTIELGKPKIITVKAYKLLDKITQTTTTLTQEVGIQQITSSWEQVLNEWYQYTTVLKYSTYYNIEAKWDYPIGSKVRVQTKWRWPPGSSNPWNDGGYIEITVDAGVVSDWRTGPYVRELQFELKYRHSIVSLGAVAIEKIYAVDTSTDPRATRELVYSWNGEPVNGPQYYDVQQETSRIISISGGEAYDFNVQIALSYPWGVSLSLGVDKNPIPYATLTIHAGTWSPGYVARIVSLSDNDFLDTRTFWYKPRIQKYFPLINPYLTPDSLTTGNHLASSN